MVCYVWYIYIIILSGADLQHNLVGNQEQEVLAEPAGEGCGKVSPSPCKARKL